jgi:hypothetical protein
MITTKATLNNHHINATSRPHRKGDATPGGHQSTGPNQVIVELSRLKCGSVGDSEVVELSVKVRVAEHSRSSPIPPRRGRAARASDDPG